VSTIGFPAHLSEFCTPWDRCDLLRRKYYATNRRSLNAKEVRTLSRKRQEVEAVLRVLKSQLSFEGCQTGYRRLGQEAARPQSNAQEHHIARCLVAYLIVERERLDRGLTWRQLKRQRILKGSQLTLPALERVRQAAELLPQVRGKDNSVQCSIHPT